MTDPFASDPRVLDLERWKRIDAALNWRDHRREYAQTQSLAAQIGPCPECGSVELIRSDITWICAECGEARIVPRWAREE